MSARRPQQQPMGMEAIRRVLAVLEDNFPPPPPAPEFGEDLGHIICACNKRKTVASMPRFHTGWVNAIDNICYGCTVPDKGLTIRVVCHTCRRVAARMTPGEDKHGFRYEKGRTYHTTGCCHCQGSGTESYLIEYTAHLGRVGRLTQAEVSARLLSGPRYANTQIKGTHASSSPQENKARPR